MRNPADSPVHAYGVKVARKCVQYIPHVCVAHVISCEPLYPGFVLFHTPSLLSFDSSVAWLCVHPMQMCICPATAREIVCVRVEIFRGVRISVFSPNSTLHMWACVLLNKCVTTSYYCHFRREQKSCEFNLYEAYAVDLIVSTGEGRTKPLDTRVTVFRKTEDVYQLKIKASRGVRVFPANKLHVFPYLIPYPLRFLLFVSSLLYLDPDVWVCITMVLQYVCTAISTLIFASVLCAYSSGVLFSAAFYSEVSSKFTVMPFSLRQVDIEV